MALKNLPFEAIRLDGGTQVRAEIDEGTVDEYALLMEQGDAFPPVEVYHDGADYWLWDGFHRYHAARQARRPNIEASITPGSRLEAVWASLDANSKHGMRLNRADKAKAILLALQARPEASDRVIAQHVGAAHKTVATYRREAEASGEIPHKEVRIGTDGRHVATHRRAAEGRSEIPNVHHQRDTAGRIYPAARPAPDPAAVPMDAPPAPAADPPPARQAEPPPAPALTPGSADPTPPPLDSGRAERLAQEPRAIAIPTPRASDPPQAAAPAEPKAERVLDCVGRPIPERLRPIFNRRGELTGLMTTLSTIRAAVEKGNAAADPLFSRINLSIFAADLNDARSALKFARPYAVCPYCGGRGCNACHSTGWVGETVYNNAPRDLKPAAQ